MVELTYLLHNQAKILKRLQIPQDDCRDKDLLFYKKIKERIHRKLIEASSPKGGQLNGRGHTKDESFDTLMELQDLKKRPHEMPPRAGHNGHQGRQNGYKGHDSIQL